MNKIIPGLALGLMVLLSGCASTFSSQVSTFHEWPSIANNEQSYIIERQPGQENNLEYKTYEEQLRGRLQSLGLNEVAATKTPSLKVAMQYATTLNEVQVFYPANAAIYDPLWRVHFHRGFYYPRYTGGPFMLNGTDINVRSSYLHQLEITMSDMVSGKKLADIKVSSEQINPEISLYMPYLIESALKDFPAKNGSTLKVELPLGK